MKKIFTFIALMLVFALSLSSCGAGGVIGKTVTSEKSGSDAQAGEKIEDNFDEALEATGDFSVTPSDASGAVSVTGAVFTISAAGEYTLSGRLEDGAVVVDAGEEDEVTLVLENATVCSSTTSPIAIISAGEATVKAEEGTYNAVYDRRTASAQADSGELDAAIYAACDLKISGKGSLSVETSYDNGVKSKDDLKIKNVTLKVTAVGNALKGNDSVTVESGSLILVSTASDGVKTSNSGVSSKGNQKGTVTISGGKVDIYAACDGVSAAYNADISGDCAVNIYTASYADGAEASAATELYLIVENSVYSESADWYAYFYNDDDTAGKWVKAEYSTMIYSGRTPYYGLAVRAPDGFANFLVNTVAAGTAPDGSNYTATSGGEALNRSMNGYLVTSAAGGVISGDWISVSSGSGSESKTTYSSKGIKAANAINVSGGYVTVFSMDDALHANAGDELENGSKGVGDVSVAGGTLVLTCADDGVHADGTLTVSDGYIKVADSHEGLEANVVNVAGGEVYVYGGDDGINACKGAVTPLVNITGGYLEVTTPSGDTDAIDSNGNFTMSGGTVIVRGGAATGGMAGSVDADGAVRVTGGTIVAFGGICEVPESGSVNYYAANGKTFAAGEYALESADGKTIVSFTLDKSYSSCWIASEELALGGSYKLSRGGENVLSWTQSSSAAGDEVRGGFGGMGGFGGGSGFGGRGKR